jgi:hypothetical protein
LTSTTFQAGSVPSAHSGRPVTAGRETCFIRLEVTGGELARKSPANTRLRQTAPRGS